jgi:hypothetical protein
MQNNKASRSMFVKVNIFSVERLHNWYWTWSVENAKPLKRESKTQNIHDQYAAQAAQLKKLKGKWFNLNLLHFYINFSICPAENDALRKASTAQPTGLASIPRPEKGVSGKGFNLRAAMGLGEDPTLYCTVRVSFFYLLLSSLLIYYT